MRTYSNSILIHASSQSVFAYMDNIAHTGMHMMHNSMAMMGSKLTLEQLSEEPIGPNARFRWFGKMMGLNMDFTVGVTKWKEDKEKVWETIGTPQMLILSWYRMFFAISPQDEDTKVKLGIDYTLPTNVFWKAIAFILAPLYASWCVNNMLNDSKKALEEPNNCLESM